MNTNEGFFRLLRAVFSGLEFESTDPDSLRRLIDKFVSELKPADQQVVRLRFGLINRPSRTLQQVGDILGITRERIRQIERRALRRLKHPVRRKQLAAYVLSKEGENEKEIGGT